MTKKILLVDRGNLVGPISAGRVGGFLLSQNNWRGHPMVSPKRADTTGFDFGPSPSPPLDYFRRSMGKYYTWKNQFFGMAFNFGFFLPRDLGFTTNAGGISYPAIGAYVTNTTELDQSTIRTIAGANLGGTVYDIIQQSGDFPHVLRYLLGRPLGGIVNTDPGSIFFNLGYEFQTLNIVGSDEEWLKYSNMYGVSGWARELFDDPDWYNWQAYVLGGASLPFQNTRRFPGIFGGGMINKFFFDHAFERQQLNPETLAVQSGYNYYDEFMDTMKNNPSILETYIPNFYAVNSILYGADGYAYSTLFHDHSTDVQDDGSIDLTKNLLSKVVGATSNAAATDILDYGDAGNITIGQIQATSQTPDSLLSRFARKDFSDPDLLSISKINRHIGMPYGVVALGQDGAKSIMESMNGREGLYPYHLKIEFPNSLSAFIEGLAPPTRQAMSNYFLFEIMKANILEYTDEYSSAAQVPQEDYLYGSIDFTAVVTDTDTNQINYYGIDFLPEDDRWTLISPGGTEAAASRAPYLLRTIDLENLFRSFYTYQLDSSNDEGKYGLEQSYNGFIGQSETLNVVKEEGLIIGEKFSTINEGTSMNGSLLLAALEEGGFGGPENLGWTLLDLSDFLSGRLRTYAEMTSGEKAPGDTLAFKVDKHTVGANGNISQSPIQSFYFANAPGVIKYIDTQVFFGKKYKYKIYAYDLVVGNQYKYTNPEVFPPIEEKYPNPLGYLLNKTVDWVLPRPQDLLGHAPVPPATLPWTVEELGLGSTSTQLPWLSTLEGTSTAGGITGFDVSISTAAESQHILLISDVGSSHMGSSFIADAAVDVEYPLWVDITIGTGANRYRQTMTLANNIILDPPIIQGVGRIGAERLAHDIENAINWQVRQYFQLYHPTQNTPEQRYNSEVRVRMAFVEQEQGTFNPATGLYDGGTSVAKFFIGQVRSLLPGVTGNASFRQFVESFGLMTFKSDFHTPQNADEIFSAYSAHVSALPGRRAMRPDSPHLGMNLFQAYFDLGPLMVPTHPGVDISLDFNSGQHGFAPQVPWDLTDGGTAKVSIFNFKSPKIIEIPIGETNIVQVADLPPQAPDVDIFPLKGSNRELKILLNNNGCKTSSYPIIIEPSDVAIFEDIKLMQGRGETQPILFGSDDSVLSYQIFRTTEKPNSYADFAGNLLQTIDAVTPFGRRVISASVLENINPNVFYYYCFRTIDKNGYLSNPSSILKVQLVDDNGRVYPIIEPYDFDLDEPRETEKSFKRYLEIDASLQEKIIHHAPAGDTQSAGNPHQAPTGVSLGDKAWGTVKFKVRIISKDTGRKIDLNLNFKAEPVPNPKLPGN